MAAKKDSEKKAETTPRTQLPEDQENRLAPVAEAFPDETKKEAVNFGRKLIKIELNMRSSAAPKGSLTDEDVAKIREILGIPAKSKKTEDEGEVEAEAAA